MRISGLVFAVLLLWGCGSREQTPAAAAPDTPAGSEVPAEPQAPAGPAAGTILLAYEKTPFKEALIMNMQALLEAEKFTVTTVEHSDKGLEADAGGYAAVFITNSGVQSRVRPWITAWLEANKDHKDKILLHTTQKSHWKVSAIADTVTSASAEADVEKLAADYAARLKAICQTETAEKKPDAQ